MAYQKYANNLTSQWLPRLDYYMAGSGNLTIVPRQIDTQYLIFGWFL